MLKSGFISAVFTILVLIGSSQELYVFSEPASNLPSKSLNLKLTDYYATTNKVYDRSSHRLMPQVSFGVSKKLMLQMGATLSNVTNESFGFESVFLYGKFRFLSLDRLHQHFRVAAFLNASYSRAPFHFDEVHDMGEKSGIRYGVIATQLWNRFALSGSLSNTQLLDKSRFDNVLYVPPHLYQSINYSLSAGLLVLPIEYKNYNQPNLNIYLELLGQKAIPYRKYYVDVAPSVQLVLNSNTKINLGARFPLSSNMQRMSEKQFLIGVERSFFSVFK